MELSESPFWHLLHSVLPCLLQTQILHIPHDKLKPLSISLSVFQSNGINWVSPLTSVAFNIPVPSKLHEKNHLANNTTSSGFKSCACFEQDALTLSLVLTTGGRLLPGTDISYMFWTERVYIIIGVDYRWQTFTWYRYIIHVLNKMS